MGWEKPTKNYMIAMLSCDRILLEDMAGYFSGMEGITIVGLSGMEEGTAERFIDSYEIDIVFVEDDSVDGAPDSPLYRIIEKALARSRGSTTHFVLRYDDQCAERVLEFGERLLEKKLPLTMSRLDEREDYIILFQTIQGILMGREQWEKRRSI